MIRQSMYKKAEEAKRPESIIRIPDLFDENDPRKRQSRGPKLGGTFWALDEFNDLPLYSYDEGKILHMKIADALKTHDVFMRDILKEAPGFEDWRKITSPDQIPEFKTGLEPVYDGDYVEREERWFAPFLPEIYIVPHEDPIEVKRKKDKWLVEHSGTLWTNPTIEKQEDGFFRLAWEYLSRDDDNVYEAQEYYEILQEAEEAKEKLLELCKRYY